MAEHTETSGSSRSSVPGVDRASTLDGRGDLQNGGASPVLFAGPYSS